MVADALVLLSALYFCSSSLDGSVGRDELEPRVTRRLLENWPSK